MELTRLICRSLQFCKMRPAIFFGLKRAWRHETRILTGLASETTEKVLRENVVVTMNIDR